MLSAEEKRRYERQILFRPLGEAGQARLRRASVAVAGVGALGAACADMLTRAGVGRLTLIDFDQVELSNLQRQMLYNEADVASGRPKAEIAAEKLAQVNSDVAIRARVARIEAGNVRELIEGADLVVDAVDNFKAKFTLNEAAVEMGVPLVYGALSGTYCLSMAVVPGKTACLRCVFREEPDAGSSETAATAGVLGATVNMVTSLQMVQAIKLLVAPEELSPGLHQVDVWDGEWNVIPAPRRPDCPVCGSGRI